MFCDSNYATYKDTRYSVRGLVAKLGGTLLTCSSKNPEDCDANHHIIRVPGIVSMHTRVKVCKYVAGKITEVKNLCVIYEDNQGAIFLAKNRQVGIFTNKIDIRNHFLREMVKKGILPYSIFRVKITLWTS